MESKISFTIDEGVGVSCTYNKVSNNDYVTVDELCAEFLKFLDKATYVNPVTISIGGFAGRDSNELVVLHNNPER